MPWTQEMSAPPHTKTKSLAGHILGELLQMSCRLGALSTEVRLRDQFQTERITRLEQRMDALPQTAPSAPSSSPSGLTFFALARFAETVRDLGRRVPWGAVAVIVAAVWNWLLPLLQRLWPL